MLTEDIYCNIYIVENMINSELATSFYIFFIKCAPLFLAAGVLGWSVPGCFSGCSSSLGQLCWRHSSGRLFCFAKSINLVVLGWSLVSTWAPSKFKNALHPNGQWFCHQLLPARDSNLQHVVCSQAERHQSGRLINSYKFNNKHIILLQQRILTHQGWDLLWYW